MNFATEAHHAVTAVTGLYKIDTSSTNFMGTPPVAGRLKKKNVRILRKPDDHQAVLGKSLTGYRNKSPVA